MGVDVCGMNPTGQLGEVFRYSWWGWRPLAGYVCDVAPDVAVHCKHWHSNDGDGLNASQCVALANRLQVEIDSGRAASYARRHTSAREMMPNEPRGICDATGTRKPVPEVGAGNPADGGIKCNGCDGSGYVPASKAGYHFEVELLQEFVTFLRHCGGFSIY